MGPTPKPTTNTIMFNNETSSLTWNVADGPPRSAVITALLKATEKQVMATVIVHHHLQALDQFLGFSLSPSLNVTSSYCSGAPVGVADIIGCKPAAISVVYSPIRACAVKVRKGRLSMSTPPETAEASSSTSCGC